MFNSLAIVALSLTLFAIGTTERSSFLKMLSPSSMQILCKTMESKQPIFNLEGLPPNLCNKIQHPIHLTICTFDDHACPAETAIKVALLQVKEQPLVYGFMSQGLKGKAESPRIRRGTITSPISFPISGILSPFHTIFTWFSHSLCEKPCEYLH